MAPFIFESIKSLALSRKDNPSIDIRNDEIVITAERNGERIVITAPLPGAAPVIAQTTVRSPRRRYARRNSVNVPKGEMHRKAKLTEQNVREMRAMAADPSIMREYPNRHQFFCEIGKIYGVHFSTVSKIVNRRSWTHV
mgnify:CR=1 FL=1